MRSAAAQTSNPEQLDLVDKIKETTTNDAKETAKIQASSEPEIVVEEEEVSQKGADTKDTVSASDALKRQLEELKRSEAAAAAARDLAIKQREEAIQAKRAQEAELAKYRQSADQSRLETITTALAAAQAEADAAERDLERAIQNADPKAQAEAQRRISKAEANIGRLEDGKYELEQALESGKRSQEQVAKRPESEPGQDVIDAMPIPDRGKEWLREHPEFATDPRKNASLQKAHWDALDQGHKAFSTGYFQAIEELVGISENKAVDNSEREVAVSEPRRAPIVSAPVSREGSAGSSRSQPSKTVRLTAAQAEAAKMAGISNAEYAKQLDAMNQLKANGHYGDR